VPHTSILTSEQLEAFERRGILRLEGFYPDAVIGPVAGRLWEDLEQRFGMFRDRPQSWTVTHPAQFRTLTRSGAFNALATPETAELADALLGAGAWDPPMSWGPLVTFPSPAADPPRPPWHLDIGACGALSPLPVMRAFTFLEPVLPGGGGTLYVAGSHRFALEIDLAQERQTRRSAQIRERLKHEHPWFARLHSARGVQLRALMNEEAEVGNHRVRLEEMTGAPGDLILMHPAMLHASAHNALIRPRMMLTLWVPRRGVSLG